MKRAIFVYTGNDIGDIIEKSMAKWAIRFNNKYKSKLKVWNIHHFFNAKTSRIEISSARLSKSCLIALWGHGRKRDGSLIDVCQKPVFTQEHFHLLRGKAIYGMFCHSIKIIKKIYNIERDDSIPALMIFNKELWIILHPENESFAGFEMVAEKALLSLFKYKNGKKAAIIYRHECVKWATFWLNNLMISKSTNNHYNAQNAYLCVCALMNNFDSVRSEADLYI